MIVCYQCEDTSKRDFSLIATITKRHEDKIIIEVTEPDERQMRVNGRLPFTFPFYLRRSGEGELEFCSLSCFRKFITATIREREKYAEIHGRG